VKNTKLEICNKCWGTGHVHGGDDNSTWTKTCEYCKGIGFIRVHMTNADRIRAMTDEELAWELMTWRIETEAKHQGVESSYPNTQATILEWLQQPAEGDA
jgi:hypothetical protein